MPPRRRAPDPDSAVAVLDLPKEPETPLQLHPDMDPKAGTRDPEADLAKDLTERFFRTYHHPFWVKFRERATMCHEFVTGTEQWDKAARAKLEKEGRAVLQINEVRPVVEIVVGYEAAAPLEGKPAPTGKEDTEDVLVFERLAKHASKKAQTEFVCSKGFKTGVTGGGAWWYVGVDYSDDFIYGTPKAVAIPYKDFVYDPGSQEYDLSDSREQFWLKTVAVDDLVAQYPKKKAEIEAALALLPESAADGFLFSDLTFPSPDRKDGYTNPILSGLQLYDKKTREVLVVECWYRTWKWHTVMVDARMERATLVPPEVLDLAEELAKLDPQVKFVKKAQREFTMCVFLPATKTFLAGGQPFENDTRHHPFVQFLAYREGDEILGLPWNLLDMQRDLNKGRSAGADFKGRAGRYKLKAHRGSLEHPEDALDDTTTTYWMKRPDLQGLQEIAPPQWPAWMTQGNEQAKQEIREASLIHAATQGQGTPSQSGLALGRLQQQSQIGISGIFHNYKWSRYLLTYLFLKRVQQCYSAEKTLRLDMGAGETAWVTINEHTVGPDGTMQVVRNIPSLDFDAEIVDSPLTPTARMAHLILWLEVITKFPPEYAESVADITMELMDTPHRDEAVRRFRAIMAKKGLIVEGNGMPGLPAGGNGAGPPAEMAPGGVTPGLVNRAMAGPAGIVEGPANAPAADTLRAVGMGMGGML